ncbi:MAG: hypothetical protein IJS61_04005 [Firmicutes bacterium]|nr:hypothetical protein [Bacillota bacterium]
MKKITFQILMRLQSIVLTIVLIYSCNVFATNLDYEEISDIGFTPKIIDFGDPQYFDLSNGYIRYSSNDSLGGGFNIVCDNTHYVDIVPDNISLEGSWSTRYEGKLKLWGKATNSYRYIQFNVGSYADIYVLAEKTQTSGLERKLVLTTDFTNSSGSFYTTQTVNYGVNLYKLTYDRLTGTTLKLGSSCENINIYQVAVVPRDTSTYHTIRGWDFSDADFVSEFNSKNTYQQFNGTGSAVVYPTISVYNLKINSAQTSNGLRTAHLLYQPKTLDDVTYLNCIKFNGEGSRHGSSLTFDVNAYSDIYIVGCSSGTDSRTVKVRNITSEATTTPNSLTFTNSLQAFHITNGNNCEQLNIFSENDGGICIYAIYIVPQSWNYDFDDVVEYINSSQSNSQSIHINDRSREKVSVITNNDELISASSIDIDD